MNSKSPAFPRSGFHGTSAFDPGDKGEPGMNLEDYFASMVAPALVARAYPNQLDLVGELAYRVARSMMKAREKV